MDNKIRTKIITICSGKGGAGKTVTAVGLAKVLSLSTPGNILLVDLDLHVRGLTFMLFPNLENLKEKKQSIAEFLLNNEGCSKKLGDIFMESCRLEASYESNVFMLPSSLEKDPKPEWESITNLSLAETHKKLEAFLSLIRKAMTFEYVILDTRAGPDDLSMTAAALADITLIMLERDRISWRSSLKFYTELEDYFKVINVSTKPTVFFFPNKTTLKYAKGAHEYLKDYDFLQPIPFDMKFYNLYGKDVFQFGLEGKGWTNTSFIFYLQKAWKNVCQQTDITLSEGIKEGLVGRFYRLWRGSYSLRFIGSFATSVIAVSLFISAIIVVEKAFNTSVITTANYDSRVNKLIVALKSGDEKERKASVIRLGLSQDPQAVQPLIFALLEDRSPNVREYAAGALGTIKSRQSVRFLMDALRDESKAVRIKAALALGDIGDIRALDQLQILMKDSYNEEVRNATMEAIKQIQYVNEFSTEPALKQ